MRFLILLTATLITAAPAAFASEDAAVFNARVIAMDCDPERSVLTLSGTCLITIQSSEEENAAPVGLVIHSDLHWDGGQFIHVDSPVFVDLFYTNNKTKELKRYFTPDVDQVYFHDIETSFGGYADVIRLQRRD